VGRGRLEAFSDGVIAIIITSWISFGIYLLIPALYFMPERKAEASP
jgi:hypothetical protein